MKEEMVVEVMKGEVVEMVELEVAEVQVMVVE